MACSRTIQACRCLCRHLWRRATISVAGIVVIAAFATPCASLADPINASVEAKVSDGYARLVFTMSDYDDASVRFANSVLIISFKKPIDVPVERLVAQLPGYVVAARRDPDGTGLRLALNQQVKVHTTTAGEKLFVDLLPESWSGVTPGLPQDVIDDLARRAHEADQILRKQHEAMPKDLVPVPVHVAVQPTFTRYVFAMPEQASVSADHPKNALTLTFDLPIKFDLSDADAVLPHAVQAINSELHDTSTVVRFSFYDKVDQRTFRDDQGYIVDIVTGDDAKADAGKLLVTPLEAPKSAPSAQAAQPGAVSADQAMADKAARPSVAAPATVAPAASQAPAAPDAPVVEPGAVKVIAPTPPPHAEPPPPPPQIRAAPTPSAGATDPPKSPAAEAPAVDVAKPEAAAPRPGPEKSAVSAGPGAAPAQSVTANTPSSAAGQSAIAHDGNGKVAVDLSRQGASLTLSFPLPTPTAAAVFQRADTLWLIFDSDAAIDLSALQDESSRTIRGADFTRTPDADIVRIKLDRPHLSSVANEGSAWIVQIGDGAIEPTHALDITRNLTGPNRSSVTIPFEQPHLVHRIDDPAAGDQLIAITAFAPARGFVNAKDFVEFRALASTHGVVVEPLADDVRVELAPDKVVISRPTGLTLSSSLQTLLHGSGLRTVMFDSQLWGFDQQASYNDRQSGLIAAAATAPEASRLAPRLDLARFYIARGMYPESKGVLDVALADERHAAENVSAVVLRAVAEIMMNRPDDALKDLADPAVGDQHDAPLWRALAYARQGKWAQARDGFKTIETAIATLPIELQRTALKDGMRSAIEVGDFSAASNQLDDFQTIGVPHDMEPAMAVLIGRLAEGLGRTEDALAAYRTAADSWDRRAAAQGQLRETVLRYSLGDLKRADVISGLETLTTIWRGDETEIEALAVLTHLYTEEGRYRDAFYVMRSAVAAHPDWEMTRKIQKEAAATFDALFLAGKGDSLSAIDALALFYDFRELTPIGRRGDEMIRRLADRLVSVDLLDQAAELLQYQVDNRLQGAARAQVATRLAVIYLMNRKPDRALATMRATRTTDLSNELRDQRLLLEARALSDLGRHDLALDVIANVDGRAAIRLRSDIHWAARRWREAAEQIELMYGERWKQWQPLTDVERSDILRAEIGYALAEDTLGLDRFREKYAAKMAQTPDAHAFEVVSAPLGTGGTEFAEIAHSAAAVDTLDGFLRDIKARYPQSNPISPALAQPEASDVDAALPKTSSARPTLAPTPAPAAPSAPPPPARAAGRTAQR